MNNWWGSRNTRILDSCVLDPDFDEIDGVLTMAQICNPQFELYKSTPLVREPGEWIPYRALYRGRKRGGAKPKVMNSDWKCHCCVPDNGHHTPNYWNTGQEDIW